MTLLSVCQYFFVDCDRKIVSKTAFAKTQPHLKL